MNEQDRREEQRGQQLGVLWREARPPQDLSDADARERFLDAAWEPLPLPVYKRPAVLAAAALLLAVLATGVILRLSAVGELNPASYGTHAMREISADHWAQASAEPGELRFDDGSVVTLIGGEVSVAAVRHHGADVVLHTGEVHVEVVHHPDTTWALHAGPATVFVTGTIFDVRWTPEEGHLYVNLYEGAVRVELEQWDTAVELSPQHDLFVDIGTGHFVVTPMDTGARPSAALDGSATVSPGTELEGDDGVGTVAERSVSPELVAAVEGAILRTPASGEEDGPTLPPMDNHGDQRVGEDAEDRQAHEREEGHVAAAVPEGGVEAPGDSTGYSVEPDRNDADAAEGASGSSSDPHVDHTRTWTEAVAAGDSEWVVTEAERALDVALDARPLDDLVALSEAARYTRRRDIAYGAQLAMRERFPASSHGRSAAFFIGRHHERASEWDEAARWYATYLDDAPSGRYVEQALGRYMTVLVEQGSLDAAREAAHRYLDAYGLGSYAPYARDLVE